ncbi:MAG TPA: universal stress protein [Alphaproteobacteria bacterium]|nr:universal stress protein [Alphaproteobacteria bacterium]
MKILLALDGSPCGNRAAKYVAECRAPIGKPFELTLLFVDYPIGVGKSRHWAEARHEQHMHRAFKQARARLRKLRIPISERYLVGDPGPSIARFAAKGKYEMVVMGSNGRSAVGRLLLGSVAEKIIALCRVPVLIVR